MVFVGAVAIVFAVGLVVLVIVTDQILKRETVMAGDEVDAGVGGPAGLLVEVGETGQARGELRCRAAVPLPEAAHVVPVAAIPFRPQHGEVADLVAAGP